MVTITVRYEGGLRCTATHGPSTTTVLTDAPRDNHGLGQSFSPTDLVATALATCAMTVMGIVAVREGIDLGGSRATVTKGMTANPARRISELPTTFELPAALTAEQRQKLEAAARSCPVAASIRPDIETNFVFRYCVPATALDG